MNFVKKYLCFVVLVLLSSTIYAAEVSVAVILSSDITPYNESLSGFKSYFDSNNIPIRLNVHNLANEKICDISAKLNTNKPAFILALGNKAAFLTESTMPDVPMIYSVEPNTKQIESTVSAGIYMQIPAKIKLKKLREMLPNIKKIGTISSLQSLEMNKDMEQACNELGFVLYKKEIENISQFSSALKEISGNIDCFIMSTDIQIFYNQSKEEFIKSIEELLLASLDKKFPVIGASSSYTKSGALLSFECDYKDIGAQTAELASYIINGKNLTTAEIKKPRKVTYSINLLTMKKLGITINDDTINKASVKYGE